MTGPYGACITCGVDLPEQGDANTHLRDTFDSASNQSHRVQVITPTPQQVARRKVDWLVQRAMEQFCDDLDRDIRRGALTAEEAREALRSYSDFADAYDEWASE